ncbi:hypothetical protein CBW65_04075 [Tumebacillus avium]|uniref:Uncharacterized protein n=1 Tax=Tumebacillus avium TaxID=1903704 RepID=A0A1Y0IJ45_9BACL|nr:GNAT family N-acetyltransferase [Tumebacillus avium]ARU60330.1 hypothetical protein CBW65_04075 [Tumebacillus avium]
MNVLNHFGWEVLDRSKHDIQGFSSGYPAFDQHLHVDAVLEQANGLSQTRVYSNGRKVIAYYSAKCTKITVDMQERSQIGAKETTVPAVEIPFLAVDQQYWRQGIGSETLEEILAQTTSISYFIGCRYVFLRAVKEQWLIDWYKKYQFKEFLFELQDDYTQPMCFKLPTVQELTLEDFEELF